MSNEFRSRLLALTAAALITSACSDEPTGPPDNPTINPPTGVTVTAVSSVAARVSFSAVSGATGYVVERAPGASGGTFTQVGTPTAPPFDDTGLTPLNVYRYRVITVSGTRRSDASSEVSLTMPDKPLVVINQDITTNTTWSASNRYRLSGFIHVQNGATLTIEAGTVIEGDYDVVGSSLFVLRGARIVANGTANAPIVFTSSRPVGQRRAGDWGGLILIGNGIINRGDPVILEGTGTGANNPAVNYAGGTNNADNSGTLRYVRVEFAGYATAPDAELNTFTFAAVGSGTTLEYLQAMHGLDDSFEWFGGAVDGKYLVSYNSGDDHFDMSEGYVGRLQFVIAYQNVQVIPRPQAGNIASDPQGIENDGCAGANCNAGQTSLPYTIPVVANFTIVGPPDGVMTQGSGNVGMMLRRGTGGHYVNGIVARYARAAISLRDQPTLDRIAAGDLTLKNLLLAQNGVTFQAPSGTTVQGTVDVAANAIEAVGATTASLFTAFPTGAPANAAAFDWTPSATSAARTGGLTTFTGQLATKAGTFITGTSYRGAADPNGAKWWQGWTNYAEQ
ncbi:MAG: fibronectin type III domain-containing protein [Gemmatimonadales bacterium]|nr:fibronectin type III domain-containing protein [Gemmatimonadales bacterium]